MDPVGPMAHGLVCACTAPEYAITIAPIKTRLRTHLAIRPRSRTQSDRNLISDPSGVNGAALPSGLTSLQLPDFDAPDLRCALAPELRTASVPRPSPAVWPAFRRG